MAAAPAAAVMREFLKMSLLGLVVGVVLVACPKEQVGPVVEGSSGGGTSTGPGVVTAEPTPTSGASTGTSSGGPVETSSTGMLETSTGAMGSSGSSTGAVEASSSSGGGGSSGEGSSSTGEPAPLFDCFGCTCDASVSFCRKVFAGFAGPGAPMCPIVEAGGLESGCVLYPRDCEPPSCACLPLMDNKCFCNESERQPGAFEVTCPLL